MAPLPIDASGSFANGTPGTGGPPPAPTVNGRPHASGEPATHHRLVSPVSGVTLEEVPLAPAASIEGRLASLAGSEQPLPRAEVFAFLDRLCAGLVERRDTLIQQSMLETGFTRADSRDLIQGSIDYLRDFRRYVDEQPEISQAPRHSYAHDNLREMRITHRPFRCVAAVVPQNASLPLSIIIIASGLYAGARVMLRPSLQCALTGATLADLVERCAPPAGSVCVLNCHASVFLEACMQADPVDLIHYIGSSAYALDVFVGAFMAKKSCLLDGQGNGVLYVDDSFPLDEAVRLITTAATRFNGETCTSVNGVLAHESIYHELRDALADSFGRLRVGHPAEASTDIGPLFSAEHAHRLERALADEPGIRMLCGGRARDAYFTPAVFERVTLSSPLVREGVFGPAVWVQPVTASAWPEWIRNNHFPLSDTILSLRPEVVRQFASVSRAARICVNADPSIESMFEPWGGYPPSGLNPVSVWIDKYRQAYQLDGRLSALPGVADAGRGGP